MLLNNISSVLMTKQTRCEEMARKGIQFNCYLFPIMKRMLFSFSDKKAEFIAFVGCNEQLLARHY